jgi:hypothetical protein
MPRPFKPSRPAAVSTAPSSPSPHSAATEPPPFDYLGTLDEVGHATHRHFEALAGLTDLLLRVATEGDDGGLTGRALLGVAQLADILTDDARRISSAFERLDMATRQIVPPAIGGAR